MPARRRYRKGRGRVTRRRKNYYYNKKKMNRPSYAIGKQLSGFPDVMIVKLAYTHEGVFTPGVASAQLLFRGNGPYDPDVLVGGGQPLGYDQWANVYERYNVHASSCTITALPINSAATGSYEIIVTPVNDTTTLSTPNDLPYAKSRYGGHIGGGGITTIKNYMSTKKIVGEVDIDDEDYSASVGASPLRQWYWNITTNSLDGMTNINMYHKIRVVYYMKFYRRRELYDV